MHESLARLFAHLLICIFIFIFILCSCIYWFIHRYICFRASITCSFICLLCTYLFDLYIHFCSFVYSFIYTYMCLYIFFTRECLDLVNTRESGSTWLSWKVVECLVSTSHWCTWPRVADSLCLVLPLFLVLMHAAVFLICMAEKLTGRVFSLGINCAFGRFPVAFFFFL